MKDEVRDLIRDTNDPRVLRAALEHTLDYLDVLADRRAEDGIHVATYTRRLISRALRNQTSHGTSRPPEMPSE